MSSSTVIVKVRTKHFDGTEKDSLLAIGIAKTEWARALLFQRCPSPEKPKGIGDWGCSLKHCDLGSVKEILENWATSPQSTVLHSDFQTLQHVKMFEAFHDTPTCLQIACLKYITTRPSTHAFKLTSYKFMSVHPSKHNTVHSGNWQHA